MIVWGVVGAVVTRRRYLKRDLDTTNTVFVGTMTGAALGPVGLLPLWARTPQLTNLLVVGPAILMVVVAAGAFAFGDPDNLCVTSGSFVASQVVNGLIIGIIYGFMALGLTLIFSILGVVSFAHGEFYMVGGMLVYWITAVWFPRHQPAVGASDGRLRHRVRHRRGVRAAVPLAHDAGPDRPAGRVRHPDHLRPGLHDPVLRAGGRRAPTRSRPPGSSASRASAWPEDSDPMWVKANSGRIEFFETVTISNPRLIAAVTCILVLLALLYFLHRTWTGKALRAVSQDKDAARHRGDQPGPDEHAGVCAGRHDRGAGRRPAGPGVLVAAAGRGDPGHAVLRDRGPRRARLAARRVPGRHPGRPGRGGGDRLHARPAERRELYPGLWHDRADADAAAAADGPFRPPLRQPARTGSSEMRRSRSQPAGRPAAGVLRRLSVHLHGRTTTTTSCIS